MNNGLQVGKKCCFDCNMSDVPLYAFLDGNNSHYFYAVHLHEHYVSKYGVRRK